MPVASSPERARPRVVGAPRDTATLDVQVRRLRARLLAEEGQSRIVTVRGVGYRFATETEPARDAHRELPSIADGFEIDLRVRRSAAPTAGAVRPAGRAPTMDGGELPEIDLRTSAGDAKMARPAAGAPS